MAYWANRCGWDQNKGWHYHIYICNGCSKKIKQVWKSIDGKIYCLHCFVKQINKNSKD